MHLLESLCYYLGLPWKRNPPSQVDASLNRRARVLLGGKRVEIGGRVLTRKQSQILSGCPGGGLVRLITMRSDIRMVVTHAQFIRQWNIIEIRKARDGHVLYLDYIWFTNAPCGFGAITFLRMAQLAKTLGLVRTELLAAGGTGAKGRSWSEHFWGYEYWPRLGFNAPLQETIRQQLQTHPLLSTATTVSEVIQTDLNWWKQYGDG
ncbi:hypothetical protein [Massilia sp. CCM 8734]|uniref:hypothetical protein n=1 Tax=Massilia sp. CCM 8734 TaxID=2609283 RepID=UPI00141DE964|nr:hypothetical protein [Massilia sp. CCM 8734]NHZ98635.1 hypothetical protein [Massilia sp. CCM 8734]